MLIKLERSQKIHHSIAQGQLEMKSKTFGMAEKYLNKDIYLEKKIQKINDDLKLI